MALTDLPTTPPPEVPSFGVHFVGRGPLVRNLLDRCHRRQFLVLSGGPKLGKSSVLRQLQWLAEQERRSSGALPPVLYVDLADGRARELFGRPWSSSPPIVLLDHCDRLLESPEPAAAAELLKRLPVAHAMVIAGGRDWRDWARAHRTSERLRSVPLAVLFDGEARSLLGRVLQPEQQEAALEMGGTHPYVLKILAQELRANPGDPADARRLAATRLGPFFEICRAAVRAGDEEALLSYLVHEGRPVSPHTAARALDRPSVKAEADVLCVLGLIRRWNRSEGAMLEAHCRLFNDWYRLERL